MRSLAQIIKAGILKKIKNKKKNNNNNTPASSVCCVLCAPDWDCAVLVFHVGIALGNRRTLVWHCAFACQNRLACMLGMLHLHAARFTLRACCSLAWSSR